MSASTEIDGRGSIGQIRIFQIIKKLYPQYKILWEQPIVAINSRFDIFVKELGIAIEVDGIQHDKVNSFFHQDPFAFKRAFKRDENKNDFCEINGIKMIRLSYDEALKIDQERLKNKIQSQEYPDSSYTFNCLT